MKGFILTENNQRLVGDMFGHSKDAFGELVFNTAMSGYEEIITDPSYAGQIIVFTYPHIGNTGINFEDRQSQKIYASGIVIRDYVAHYSNYRAKLSLGQWLQEEGVPGIAGIDTRALVKQIREHGNLQATITTDEFLQCYSDRRVSRLVDNTMVKSPVKICEGEGRSLVILDFGIKQGIVELLVNKGYPVIIMPGNASMDMILEKSPRAIVYSNGPGDPEDCQDAINTAKKILEHEIPVFGICLGFQILSLALGGITSKLSFGHHGANHPVQDLESRRVMISSQNHNYVVLEESLGSDIVITHRSLFDGTVQGFKHRTKPIMGFQGHPEGSPGPHDVKTVFESFVKQAVAWE